MPAGATQILQNYVDQGVTEVVLDYGKPTNAIKLPDDSIAFQWNRKASYTTPSTTSIYSSGSCAIATTFGSGTSYQECL